MGKLVVHRAKWVFPVKGHPVENGGVVVSGKRILDAGRYDELSYVPGAPVVDHGEVVLIPGVVNAHTHLELSVFRELGRNRHEGGFLSWVRDLLEARSVVGEDAVFESYDEALKELRDFGTAVVADIGNDPQNYSRLKSFSGGGLFFLEVLGFSVENINETVAGSDRAKSFMEECEDAGSLSTSFQLAAHAVYSTSPALIWQVKKLNKRYRKAMSIHVAEHPGELEFLMTGKGECRELLEVRGQWNPSWKAPRCSPVEYLDSLGVLDKSTICVHLVFVEDRDLSLLAGRKVPVVVCPRSNVRLSGVLPPVKKIINGNLTWGVGTDSLASNTDLNLFGEMAVLANDLNLDPEVVVRAATMGGAEVLGISGYFGSLDEGKTADIIKIPVTAGTGKEIFHEIIEKGEMGEIQWLTQSVL